MTTPKDDITEENKLDATGHVGAEELYANVEMESWVQPDWAKGRYIKFKFGTEQSSESLIATLTYLLWDLRETLPEMEALFEKYGIEIIKENENIKDLLKDVE